MRKITSFVLISIGLLAFIITGCIRSENQLIYLAEGINMIKTDRGYDVYALTDYQAIEILFHERIETAYEHINTPSDFLALKKTTADGLLLSLTKKTGSIERDERLFSISKLESTAIKSVKILQEPSKERAVSPLPDGISALDMEISPDQSFDLLIYSKNISQLTGVEFTLHFDPAKLIIDPNYLETYLEKSGAFVNALIIKNKTNDTIQVSAAFQSPVSLSEELSLRIKMKALSQIGTTTVYFTDMTALDAGGNPMTVFFSPATIDISSTLTPEFLGDFNGDDEIGLADFQLFAQKYGSQSGDGIYNILYDIGPAQDYFQGDWDGIYDVKIPDGKVNIIDFVVFTNNYGQTKPENTDQPPSAPSGPNPVNNAENIPLETLLQWQESVDPEGGSVTYDVYLDQNSQPTTYQGNSSIEQYTISGLSNATTYYWQIVAEDDSGNRVAGSIWRFTTTEAADSPPTAPTNPTPGSEAEDQETSLTLSWNPSTDPEGSAVYYDLYFGTQENPPLNVSNLTTTQYQKGGLSNDTLYYWKVVAKDEQSNSTSGPVWQFRTKSSDNNPPTQPDNPSPVSGSTNRETSLTLGWNTSTDPDSDPITYELYLDKNVNPTTLRDSLSTNSFTITGLSYSTKYYWKVIAKDNHGGSTSSLVWNFTTTAAPSGNPQYRGLTLGLTDYGGSGDLSATDDDADEIKITFENLTNTFSVQKQTGYITKTQIQNWINTFVSGSSSSDVFLFHYSGHGYYESGQSRLYLSDGSNISMTELRSYLNTINGTKIVLIDACESGNFTSLSSGRQMTRQERIEQMTLFNQGVLQAFEEDTDQRGTFDSEYQYYVLTGAAIDEYSYEDGYLNHGFFTFFFSDGLGNVGSSNPNGSFDYTYNADGYGTGGVLDGQVTFRELYNYSKDKVLDYIQADSGDTQTVQGNHTTSDFIVGTYASSQNNPPSKPSNPTPVSGSLGVSTTQSLSWSASGATGYDVYFGTSSNPPKVSTNQSFNSYNPGVLSTGQKYYWKIVARNSFGTATGNVWNFTTQSSQPSSGDGRVVLKSQTPEVTGNMSFDYDYAYYDTTNQIPPHWIVENTGSLYFTFEGREDFYFHAYGLKEWNDDAEIDVYINDEYAGWFALTQSWGTYYIPEQYLSTGENTVELWIYWGEIYIDEAWTGEGQVENTPPSVPSNPSPSNGGSITDQTPQLSWQSTGADTYDVYFGTTNNPPKVASDQANNSYSPSTLSVGQTYYWKITAKNAVGSTPGSLWNFSVVSDSPQTGVDFTSPYSGNYLLINNESENGNTTQYTGTLASAQRKEAASRTVVIPKGLPLDAYRIDPVPDRSFEPDRSLLVSRVEQTQRAVGDTRSFTVYNFKTGSDQQLTATLQAEGQYCKIWVESTAQITISKAQQMADEFDDVIYPQITQNFYTPSDVNSDGKIAILVFDIQDDFDTTGGYVGGYFWSRDLFNMAGSNLMEIFYIDTYPTMHYPQSNPIDVSSAFSTLAHEFQHMVNFNRNYIIEATGEMSTWIDEGLSMAAERLVYGPSVVQSRVSYYNNSPGVRDGHSLLYWDDSGETLANYALSYVFMQYFRIQMEQGTSIYKDLITDYANDYRCIQNALDEHASSISFGDFLTNWRIAMMINESTGVYGFKGDSSFNTIQTPLYTGGNKNLRGGGALVKTLSSQFSDPGNAGADIQYVGMP